MRETEAERLEREANEAAIRAKRAAERKRRMAANRAAEPVQPERTCERRHEAMIERHRAALRGEDVGVPPIHNVPISPQVLRDEAEQQAEAERQKKIRQRPKPAPEPAPEPTPPRRDALAERDRQLAQAIARALKGNLNDV